VKAAEEAKNKVREQKKRAAQEEILRLEQVFHIAPKISLATLLFFDIMLFQEAAAAKSIAAQNAVAASEQRAAAAAARQQRQDEETRLLRQKKEEEAQQLAREQQAAAAAKERADRRLAKQQREEVIVSHYRVHHDIALLSLFLFEFANTAFRLKLRQLLPRQKQKERELPIVKQERQPLSHHLQQLRPPFPPMITAKSAKSTPLLVLSQS
jgi:hypothetical protein